MNVCIVGCGNIGQTHINAVMTAKNATLYGVCDIVAERADKYATEYNVLPFYSFDKMLEDENINSIHICTPHYLHKSMAISCVKRGKSVVLEKPATMNINEFEQLELATKMYSNNLCVVLQNRTNDCVVALKRIIDEQNDTGKLIGIRGVLTWNRDANYYNADKWRGKWATEGGGLLINQAIHTIDLMGYLGGKILSVQGSISNKSLKNIIEVEDTAEAIFTMENGVIGAFYATNAYSTNTPPQIELNFENVTYRYADNYLYEIKPKSAPTIIAHDTEEINGKPYWGAGHIKVIHNFYCQLENNTNNYTHLIDAKNTTLAMLSIYESAKNNGIAVKIH